MESNITIESLRCFSCLGKYIRCASCQNDELKFNDHWKTVCKNAACPNQNKEGDVVQVEEIAVCKTCRTNFPCQVEHCTMIAKRKCQKCPRFIGLCNEHNLPHNRKDSQSNSHRQHVEMCEGCERKYCDMCDDMKNYRTASCELCGVRQCNSCFDFKEELHDGKIVSYVCLLCKPLSNRELLEHNILLTVNLEQCFKAYGRYYKCTVQVKSGTVVKTVMKENVIREMMSKAKARGTVSSFIQANWDKICYECDE